MNTKNMVKDCRKKRAALHNIGCKVNAYETEIMGEMLKAEGYEIVPFSEEADLYLINTCTVTHTADQKSRQMISRARKKNKDAVVIATGCFVETLKKRPKNSDIAIGNNRKSNLIKLLREYEKNNLPIEEFTEDNLRDIAFDDLKNYDKKLHTRAYLKVQDGCDRFCSYCIIPFARGPVRSRTILDVIEEAKELTNRGYKEIILTGIHLSSYTDGENKEKGLSDLIKALSVNKDIKRIRLSSLEPNIITKSFLEDIKEVSALCPHFHLSLQSGCDETLKRMNRRYTTERFKAACELLRSYYDNPAITTDVIVGFPGETEDEFLKTREFIREINFYELHVFKYSKREGTRAKDFKDQVDEDTKNKRSRELIDLGEHLKKSFEDKLIGKEEEILTEDMEKINGKTFLTGHTKRYVKLYTDPSYCDKNTIFKGTVRRDENNDILLLQG